MILKFLITIYYIKRIAKFLFSYSQMSNWNYRKRSKTKPCVTKVNGFRPSTLVKRFPSQKFLRQSQIRL